MTTLCDFPKLAFAALLLVACAACVAAYDPGPYGYAPGPGYGYAGDYPWDFGAQVDIANGYGRGWHPHGGWGGGRPAFAHAAHVSGGSRGGDGRGEDIRRR